MDGSRLDRQRLEYLPNLNGRMSILVDNNDFGGNDTIGVFEIARDHQCKKEMGSFFRDLTLLNTRFGSSTVVDHVHPECWAAKRIGFDALTCFPVHSQLDLDMERTNRAEAAQVVPSGMSRSEMLEGGEKQNRVSVS